MPACSVEAGILRSSRFLIIAAALACACLLGRPAGAAGAHSYEDGSAALLGGDYATAWRILLPLAQAGDHRAQNDIGVMYGRGLGVPESYVESAKWIKLAAEQGNGEAQSTLGYMYYRARGVEKDYAAAALWTRRAAEQGIASAQSNLGLLYDRGEGVEQDYAEALRWYRRSAEQGYAEGQRNLGSMYEHGHGVTADPVMAYAWYGVASAAGDEPALALRARIAKRMTQEQIRRARSIARELHLRYADPGQKVP